MQLSQLIIKKMLLHVVLLGGLWSALSVPARHFAPQSLPSPTQSALLDSLLHSDPQLNAVASRPAEYELQVIYTQIHRDAQNQPHFTQHSFGLDARQYFNPASLVKLPVAVLALEKLNKLNKPGLTLNSPMATGTAYRCQTAVPYNAARDTDYQFTVGNYIKRMLLVSDNQAYNRLYEFLGQRPLNERLWELGYPAARIVRRFAPCDTAANRHTNPITFYGAGGQIIYSQAPIVNKQPLSYPFGTIRKGQAHIAAGRLIQQPYDFTSANYMSLQDITDMLKGIMFSDALPASRRFALTTGDYTFLRRYLSSTPHSSNFAPYRGASYFDAYKKYLYYGRSRTAAADSTLTIYNVVGMSHGYLADVAYFVDFAHGTEFMLSAALYVNKDGIINDGVYEYTTVGLPFLAKLGQVIRAYEHTRR